MCYSNKYIRRKDSRRTEIWSYGCDQREGHDEGKLELTRQVFRGFLKDVTEGLFLIWKGQRVPKNRGIVTESDGLICELCDQRWGCEGT